MSEEMKLCPFCGEHNAIIVETDYEVNTDIVPAYAVSCRTKRCAASIWALSMGLFDTKEKAIKAWNTRTTPEFKYAHGEDLFDTMEDGVDYGSYLAGFNAARELK